MIYKAIEKKQKVVDPDKFNVRIVEDNLAEVEAMQQILVMIMDEELLRKGQTDQQIKCGYGKITAYRLATRGKMVLPLLSNVLVLLSVYYLDVLVRYDYY